MRPSDRRRSFNIRGNAQPGRLEATERAEIGRLPADNWHRRRPWIERSCCVAGYCAGGARRRCRRGLGLRIWLRRRLLARQLLFAAAASVADKPTSAMAAAAATIINFLIASSPLRFASYEAWVT